MTTGKTIIQWTLALALSAAFALAADGDQNPTPEVSRTVYGGDHGTTVNFDNDAVANGKAQDIRANITAGVPLISAQVRTIDLELKWLKRKYESERTKAIFSGTATIDSVADKGYRSIFRGVIGGNGGTPSDNTWDFVGRLRQKCNHDSFPIPRGANCEFDVIDKIVIGKINPAGVNRNGEGAISHFWSFGHSFVNRTHTEDMYPERCKICGKKVTYSCERDDHQATDFFDQTDRQVPGDYNIYCNECRVKNNSNFISNISKTCHVRVACMSQHPCYRPEDSCMVEFVKGPNRIISDDGNTITIVVGDRDAVRVSPASFTLEMPCHGEYGPYDRRWGEPCGEPCTVRSFKHYMLNNVNFDKPGVYEIECREQAETSQANSDPSEGTIVNRRNCGVKKKVIVHDHGRVESITITDEHVGHEQRTITVKANESGCLEMVPSKSTAPVNVWLQANCIKQGLMPKNPRWTCNGETKLGATASFSLWETGKTVIALDTDYQEHFEVVVDVKSCKETNIGIQPGPIVKLIAGKLNEALSGSPSPVTLEIATPEGSLSVKNWTWKELPKSPEAIETYTITGGFDPLLGMALKARTPSPVPFFMRKYINAEAYIKAGFELSCLLGYTWDIAEDGKHAEGSWAEGSGGSVTVSVSVGAEIKAGKWASVEAIGESNGTVTANPARDDDGYPCLDLVGEFKPLVCKLQITLADGGIDYTDEWTVFDKKEFEIYRWTPWSGTQE